MAAQGVERFRTARTAKSLMGEHQLEESGQVYDCPVYRGQGSKHDIRALLVGDEQESAPAGDSSLLSLPLSCGSKEPREWTTRGVAIVAMPD